MESPLAFYRWSELDRTTYPGLRERVLEFEHAGFIPRPRSYPGHPRRPLARARPRPLASLDRALLRRRSVRALRAGLPPERVLGRLLGLSHGVCGAQGRGPAPSAGGLQALELYLAVLEAGWLAEGACHYDREGHHLSLLREGPGRARWMELAPSLGLVSGGALLWIVVGDGSRVEKKYAERGYRFLLLEAGHLMQNLCLVSASLGLATVPLGAFFEREIAAELGLPPTDVVLYLGVCGRPGQETSLDGRAPLERTE